MSGPQNWALPVVKDLCADSSDLLWFGEAKSQGGHDCDRYRQFLGSEYSTLVYNAYSGVRANALMALSGVVKQSGLMILLCPEFEAWPTFEDPKRENRSSFGYASNPKGSAFVRMLSSKIQGDEDVVLITPEQFRGRVATYHPDALATPVEGPCDNAEQLEAVNNIQKVLSGHRNRPFVLTADRGRGKSSALGIAAAQLMAEQGKKLLLTAPNESAVKQVFSHAEDLLPQHNKDTNTLSYQHGQLQFVPPDQLLETKPQGDLLMVDEAAAIPAPMLQAMTQNYSRVVFSTTVHGYEGSGRGFDVRFKHFLDEHNQGWRQQHITHPIRWFEGDVLESFWFDVMQMKDVSTSGKAEVDSLTFATLKKETLIEQPELLQQLFSLLVNAHYQTTPDDLIRLLDNEDQLVTVLQDDDAIVAAALLADEGGDKLKGLANDIASGRRRVQGHLIPQNLAYHYANPETASASILRVVRIAVTPSLQRSGLGAKLLGHVSDWAQARGHRYLGASFGASTSLLVFWQRCGFHSVKLGDKRDASSGEHSLIVLKALHDNEAEHLALTRQGFWQNLCYQLPRRLQDLSPSLVASLLNELHPLLPSSDTNDCDDVIRDFVNQSRSLDSCHRYLHDFLLSRLRQGLGHAINCELLIAKELQNWSKPQLVKHFQLTGKKQLEQRLRELCRELLG